MAELRGRSISSADNGSAPRTRSFRHLRVRPSPVCQSPHVQGPRCVDRPATPKPDRAFDFPSNHRLLQSEWVFECIQIEIDRLVSMRLDGRIGAGDFKQNKLYFFSVVVCGPIPSALYP